MVKFIELAFCRFALVSPDRVNQRVFRLFPENGISLFMVKRIIENAGGKITVQSEEGINTEFKIYFQAAM